MKKFVMLFLTAVLLSVASGSLTSCRNTGHNKDVGSDSTEVVSNASQFTTPIFSDVDIFVDYANDEIGHTVFVHAIAKMDPVTVITIARSAKSHNNGYITWKSWLQEYRSSKDVYDMQDKVNKEQKLVPSTSDTSSSADRQVDSTNTKDSGPSQLSNVKILLEAVI